MKGSWAFLLIAALRTADLAAEEPFSFAKTPGLLPKDIVPRNYVLRLAPDLQKLTTSGSVDIQLEVREATDRIQLNAQDLKITRATLDTTELSKPEWDATNAVITFHLPQKITPGTHTLHLEFTGEIRATPDGLYFVDYQVDGEKQRLLATQMEPADARSVFPCWDEPVFRATFELEAVVPADFTAVSNMPAKSEEPQPDGRKLVRFEKSPSMPTYLLALVAGKLEVLRDEVDGIALGIYTVAGKREQARYAMEATKRILPFYQEYFGVRYPLPKLDQIAIPDKGGAMENWGAITYGENCLLFEEGKSSQRTREVIFEIVAHEIAHQWFGNLVTMAWWDNLWLNEGFASWMASKTTDHFNPEWLIWIRANGEKEGAMWFDAQRTTHPIQQPVKTVGETEDMFDAISYEKGQAFIRMLETFLGEEKFRAGLRDYMKTHAWSNTTTADLWAALEKASGQPVRELAACWTEHPGFPVVSLGMDGKKLSWKQERFTIGGASPASPPWSIPFAFLHPGEERPATTLLATSAGQLQVTDLARPIKGNAGNTGYYRVAYSPELRRSLVRSMEKLPLADRLNFLSDTMAMVVAGKAPLSDYFEIAGALKGDHAFPIVSQIVDALDWIDHLLRSSPEREKFRAHAIATIRPQFRRLGWNAKPDELSTDALLRARMIDALGKWGDAEVLAEADRRFKAFEADSSSLPADLRQPVLKITGRRADAARYARLRQLATTADGTEESRLFFGALASAQDPALAQKTLAMSLDDSVPPGTATRLVQWVAWDGEQSKLAWKFISDNFPALKKRVGSIGSNDYFPEIAQSLIAPDAEKKLTAFAKKNLTAKESAAVARASEEIRIEKELRGRIASQVATLFPD